MIIVILMALRLYQNIFNLPSSANTEKELDQTVFLNLNGVIHRENNQIQRAIRNIMVTRMHLDNVVMTEMYHLYLSNTRDFLEFNMDFDGGIISRESMKFRITVMSSKKKVIKLWITSIEQFTNELVQMKY